MYRFAEVPAQEVDYANVAVHTARAHDPFRSFERFVGRVRRSLRLQ
jgi:hypothetical protein